jgi:hypothetical protein
LGRDFWYLIRASGSHLKIRASGSHLNNQHLTSACLDGYSPAWLDAAVEKLKGEWWERLRERLGDSSRDMLVYVGQRPCGLKLKELASVGGLESYAAAGMAIQRYAAKLTRDKADLARLNKIMEMLNVEM